MLIYVGIDEAGYGPLLGPLVVARSVFRLSRCAERDEPPCLWGLLAPAVGRGADREAPLAVDDSKRLYSGGSLGRLECGLLGLLPVDPLPASLARLLQALAADGESAAPTLPWYADSSGGPALPAAAAADSLAQARAAAACATAAAGVEVVEARAAVVYEDRFNRSVVETGNKASCAWRFVAGHLRDVWRQHGEQAPFVALDRQGGRRFYAPALERLFPEARVGVAGESPDCSRYEVRDGGRLLRLEVRTAAESAHLPVAYASMAAKYLRELLMGRFQRYWSEKAPDVRPTAGYYSDGRRFLNELSPRLRALEIPAGSLVRLC